MWPGAHHHMDDFEGAAAIEASRMANMLQHVPLAMSLCRVDYANHLKMQSTMSNHMYAPSAFEGYVYDTTTARLSLSTHNSAVDDLGILSKRNK